MAKLKKMLLDEASVFYIDTEIKTFNCNGVDVSYREYLTLNEKVSFVKEIVDLCITKEGLFQPALFDFAQRCITIDYYSNIQAPAGAKKLNNLAYGTKVYDELINHINKEEHAALVEAAKKEIEQVTHKDSFETLVNLVADYFDGIEKSVEGVDLDNLTKLLQSVSNIEDKKSLVENMSSLYVKEN